MLESVGSVSFGDGLLLLEDEGGHYFVHHVVHSLLELLSFLLSGLRVLEIALASDLHATPVHGPLFRSKALITDAGLVALRAHFDGFQELSVFLSNWLHYLRPVELYFIGGTLDDIC